MVRRNGQRVEPPRFEPWVATSSTLMFSTLELEQGGDIERERDLLWKPVGLWIGAQGYYKKGTSWATGGWRGDLSLGLELFTLQASPSIGIQHTTGYEWHARPRFTSSSAAPPPCARPPPPAPAARSSRAAARRRLDAFSL